jgi:hypothetical protein
MLTVHQGWWSLKWLGTGPRNSLLDGKVYLDLPLGSNQHSRPSLPCTSSLHHTYPMAAIAIRAPSGTPLHATVPERRDAGYGHPDHFSPPCRERTASSDVPSTIIGAPWSPAPLPLLALCHRIPVGGTVMQPHPRALLPSVTVSHPPHLRRV